MRVLGSLLFGLGLAIGAAISLGMLFGASIPGMPWLVAVGMVKRAFGGALGLIAGGAVLHRLAARDRRHDLLRPALA